MWKRKVVGEIATDKSIKLGAAVTNCMPNAGHTFVDENGEAIVFRNIPVSSVNPDTELFIGPGSAIDMEVFAQEYEKAKKYFGDRKIYVHEMVPLIEERHKEYERANIKSGSTFKGCGAVTQEKVVRDKRLEFFKTFKNAVACSNAEWLERLYEHLDNPYEYVMMEGAQGCDLDLNHSGNYPYVTSRNVSTAQLLADYEYPPNLIIDQSEQTTVTKMERRIFDLDIAKLKTNCQINTPSSLYLNFFQHLGLEYASKKGNYDDYYFNRYPREYFSWLEDATGIDIAALGTGSKNGERILKKELLREIQRDGVNE